MNCLIVLAFIILSICATPEERAKEVLDRMSDDDVHHMVFGKLPGLLRSKHAGHIPGLPDVGVPELWLSDGPQGCGNGMKDTTVFPAVSALAALWDRDVAYKYAKAIAQEQRIKGTSIHLGPMHNIARVPFAGRNYESMGEDPYLASELVRKYVSGVQSEHIMACAKHFAMNNQEHARMRVNVQCDQRTMRELYYPAFIAAVDAGVGSVMCSYNKVNGTHACQNLELLLNDLKGSMNFTGFVMSDWFATHSTVDSANHGLDMEMPIGEFFGVALKQKVKSGEVSMSTIREKVFRILVSMFRVGLFDYPVHGNKTADATSPERTELARMVAAQGTVLVKNDHGILPLNQTVRCIAVFGKYASEKELSTGGGSGRVHAAAHVSPLDGIKKAFPNAAVAYDNGADASTVCATAQQSDVAVVVGGLPTSEGFDLKTLSLGADFDRLVQTVASCTPAAVVAVTAPGPVLLPFLNVTDAVLVRFYPGQEDGNALGDVLSGAQYPSGRVPFSFPVSEHDTWLTSEQQYPGVDHETVYSEGMYVGYRWYAATNKTALLPFGYGLTYTTFNYSQATVAEDGENVVVGFELTNTGDLSGTEVPQLYLSFPPQCDEPPIVLKGFERVHLESGRKQKVTFTLLPRDLSVWSVEQQKYVQCNGEYTAYIAQHSGAYKNGLSVKFTK